MDVLLIRHTAVDAEPGTCYGRRDVPLVEPCETAFQWLDGGLPAIDAVVSSPLRRCARLGQWLAARRGVPLSHDARWQELDFGQWEGRRWDDIGRTQRSALDRWALDPLGFVAPGGESVRALHLRVQAGLHELHARATTAGWRRVAVVSHGGPIRALLAQAMGLAATKINALDIPCGGAFALRRVDAGWQRVTLETVRCGPDDLSEEDF
ncbi:MAG: alpha-ribazole phosphatase family protein [Burkholderiales bacterium]